MAKKEITIIYITYLKAPFGFLRFESVDTCASQSWISSLDPILTCTRINSMFEAKYVKPHGFYAHIGNFTSNRCNLKVGAVFFLGYSSEKGKGASI